MTIDLGDVGSRPGEQRSRPRERYVRWPAIKEAVRGHETQILDALDISWRPDRGKTHTHCPFPDHPDENPSWRWDSEKSHFFCSCGSGSIFDVIQKIVGVDFDTAKIRAVEMIGREDLIVDPSSPRGLTLEQFSEAKRLPVSWLKLMGLHQNSYGKVPAVWIPFINERGVQQTVQFRVALKGDKSQLFKRKTTVCLYGAHQVAGLSEVGYAIICEGVSDTLTLWYHGFPALGLPGAGNWDEDRDAHLFDGVPVIFVVIEPDKGGEAIMKWLSRSSIAPRVRLVRMTPAAKDPSALYLADPDNFKATFQAALDAAEQFPTAMIIKLPNTRKRDLPDIIVKTGKLHEAADDGLEAMQTMGVEFYQRDRTMVRVARIKAKASDGTITTTPGIVQVTLPMLRRALGQSARWQRYSDKNELLPIDPPKDVVEQIGSMVGEWPFPPLAGVIGAPTLRPDGSLLSHEGYDPATGLALLEPPRMPAIPDKPTRLDAERALALLNDLLSEFPFVDGQISESQSVALSMLMTPVLRGGLPPAVPIHLVTKPAPGSGGSYLSDIASTIATGERCAVISVAPKPEETEKRLIGAAISGQPIIPLDNCSTPLDGDFLCQVSERPVLQLRPLGTSDPVRVANTFCVFANGNQGAVTNDVIRRTIICAIDANMEHPEDRSFEKNPLAMVSANRGKYIAAILMIARAYIIAGRPDKLKPLPSFERWSDTVRSSLIWLGRPDPVSTMATARTQDEPRQQRAAVFHAWATEYYLGGGFSTSEIVAAADETHPYSPNLYTPQGWIRPQFRDALLAVAEQRGPGNTKVICPKRLGKWLKNNTNNISSDYKLTVDQSDSQRLRWRLSVTPK